MDWKFSLFITIFLLSVGAVFCYMGYVITQDNKTTRKRAEFAAACRKATDQAEHFRTVTRPRVCREDTAECRKLERELFVAVTTQCAKVVK